MRAAILILLVIFFISCSGNSDVSRKLSGSDSLVINFYGAGSDSIVRSVATSEKSALRRITEFVSSKETEIFKCGYDGNLLFYEKGKPVSDVSFKFKDENCRHFLIDIKGKLVSTKMNNEAADFLKGLEEGRATY